MKLRRSILLLLFATASPDALRAAPADKLLDEGWHAVQNGVPAASIEKFQTAVQSAAIPAAKERASLLLAHALLECNRPDDAIEAVRDLQSAAARRVQGMAWAAKGMWAKALPFFERATGDEGSFPVERRNLLRVHAEALRSLGRFDDAVDVLKNVEDDRILLLQRAELYLEAGDLASCEKDVALARKLGGGGKGTELYERYLRARMVLASGRTAEATPLLEELWNEALPDLVATGVAIALCDARLAGGAADLADDILDEVISKRPQSIFLDRAFARLDALSEQHDNPPDPALYKWAKDDLQSRRALAQFYLGKAELRAKKADHALKRLDNFTKENPTHILASDAHLLRARILAADGKTVEALAASEEAMRAAVTPDSLAKSEIEAGLLHFNAREYILAVNLFRSAAEHSSKLWEQAMYNSAIAWLNQGNYEKFQEDYRLIVARNPSSSLPGTLLLEAGLQQARTNSDVASSTLRSFIAKFPDHARVNEARVALAEIEFLSSNNLSETAGYLRVVNEHPDDPSSERAEFLGIFVADRPGSRDTARVIDLARAFLKRFPDSPLKEQVRMKLGQSLFRNEDYASAQTQLELLAKENPESPLVEGALFLAGQASVRTLNTESLNHALELFAEVAKRNGTFRLAARQQQALIQARLERYEEAIVVYDNILASAPDMDARCAAMLGKGDSLFALGTTDPKRYEQALDVYQELAKTADIAPDCRNQALYKKSQCLSKLGREEASIVPLYDLLDVQLAPGQPAEYFWFYKGGFEAGQKLELRKDWRSAVGIYQRLASIEGPRADEARERANKLRLEHFLWEE